MLNLFEPAWNKLKYDWLLPPVLLGLGTWLSPHPPPSNLCHLLDLARHSPMQVPRNCATQELVHVAVDSTR